MQYIPQWFKDMPFVAVWCMGYGAGTTIVNLINYLSR